MPQFFKLWLTFDRFSSSPSQKKVLFSINNNFSSQPVSSSCATSDWKHVWVYWYYKVLSCKSRSYVIMLTFFMLYSTKSANGFSLLDVAKKQQNRLNRMHFFPSLTFDGIFSKVSVWIEIWFYRDKSWNRQQNNLTCFLCVCEIWLTFEEFPYFQ